MYTFNRFNIARLMSLIGICSYFLTQLCIPFAYAATSSIDFSTSSNYTYDNTKILVSGGIAQLKATSTVPWYNASWANRKQIIVTSNASSQTNYQTKITIPYSAGMQAGFGDLRFTSSDGTTLLSHWLESETDSVTADVWVKIPSLGASPATTSIYMYYGNPSTTSSSNGDNTFIFFDDFSGVSTYTGVWNNYEGNPILSTSTASWETFYVGDPWVMYDAGNSVYRMWYYGYNTTKAQVGYATSSDGVTWLKYQGNPVIATGTAGTYDSLYAHKPSVVLKNGVYYLYYSADNGTTRTIAVATSSNPQGPFTKYASNPIISPSQGFESSFLDTPSAMFDTDDNTWKMWFSCGTVIVGEPKYWCYATSTDGYSWTKYVNNPIASPPNDGSFLSKALGGTDVLKVNGVYQMYYNAFDNSDVSRMGYATSTDPVTWTLRNSDKTLDLGSAGTWNSTMVYRPNVLIVNGQRQMWYNAKGTNSNEQIGTAFLGTSTVIDTTKWTRSNAGKCSIGIVNGYLLFNEFAGGNLDACMLRTTSYLPGNNVVIEDKVKTINILDSLLGQTQFITFSDLFPFTSATNNNQFLFADQGTHDVKHQSKNSGAWGTEDQVYASYPNPGAWYQARAVKKSTGIDWTWLDAANSILGSLIGNTDAPTNFSYPVSIGARGTENAFDWFRTRQYATAEPTSAIQSVDTSYDTGNPSITLNAGSAVTFTSLSGFSETATKNGGEIKYQVSNDGGTTWYWYNSGWTTTSSGYSQSSTASVINSNIATLPVGGGQFVFRAYFHSDGTQLVQLSSVTVNYLNQVVQNTPPVATTTVSSGSSSSGSSILPGSIAYQNWLAMLPAEYRATLGQSKSSSTTIQSFTNISNVTGASFLRNLSIGMHGADVRLLQMWLNSHGYIVSKLGNGSPGMETDTFGLLTKKAVMKLQKDNKISITGTVGPLTRKVIK